MNQRRALELALGALENSIDTVRNEYESDWRHGMPTRQAQLDSMKQMLDQHESAITAVREALAQPEQEPLITPADIEQLARIEKLVDKIDPYEAQPEPEPVGTVRMMVEGRDFSIEPKREWVGLTDEEKELFKGLGFVGIDAIEAKLREKNR